ncbi:lactonase family protein [Pseudomonas qingdaonensis]|uniref:lactonase family protein n=1 Tax=Pseudomonas qingdaonensis TaxID=2056231 RepID=UPI0028B1E821|nr:lactonase family protein [Pseudomonas qingdaonensis]
MKRQLMSLLTASAMALTLNAHGHELLVGTHDGVYRYRFDSQRGQLDPTPLQVLRSSNPSWLTLSPDRRNVFAVNENGDGQGQVSSFARAHDSGELSLSSQVSSDGDEPTHSSLSLDGRYLFVANYGVKPEPGGSLSVLPVAADGRLSASVQQVRHVASGVNPERQAGPHVHSVVPSPDGRYLFASDLGADQVIGYCYQPQTPTRPLGAATPVVLPPGSGPRHLAFGPNGKHAYLTLEMSAQLVVFDYHDGTLSQRQILPLTEQADAAAKAASAVHVSADGRFVYVSNRGTRNELIVFAIDRQDGSLRQVQRRSVEGDHPREFTLDPTGGYVLVGNQQSNQIVVIRRDAQTGLLGEVVQTLALQSPSDLKFVD